jgi:HSP20 family molecular chaperone IbpA
MRQHDRQIVQQMMNLSSNTPRYDILEDDQKFELAIDVPGVRLEDISVTLEQGGKLLKIGGFRRHHRQSYSLSSTNGKRQNYVDSSFKFDQMFTLDDTIVDIKNIEVTLSNGVLVVTVPKLVVDPNVKKDLVVQKIPIKVEYNQQDKHKEDNTLKEVQTEESGNRQNDQEYEHVVQSSFVPKNDDSDDLEISEEEDI